MTCIRAELEMGWDGMGDGKSEFARIEDGVREHNALIVGMPSLFGSAKLEC